MPSAFFAHGCVPRLTPALLTSTSSRECVSRILFANSWIDALLRDPRGLPR
jgi:hypothetical protein